MIVIFIESMRGKRSIHWLAALTLIGFSAIGYLIIVFLFENRFTIIFEHGWPIWQQIPVGLIYGFLAALIGWQVIKLPVLQTTRTAYSRLIRSLNLNAFSILFISFCAGVGEEVLFRGALQPMLGVWFTAVLFVALHGYLNPTNWRMSIYGAFMTLAIVGIGYMSKHWGIVSAMAAHFMVDVVLLYKLTNDKEDHIIIIPRN